MNTALIKFFSSEDGAVTVDWVVLTASVVGLGLLIITPIAVGTDGLSDILTTYIGTVAVGGSSTP